MADAVDDSGYATEPDVDPGEPVAVLAELGQRPTAGFAARIRDRIQRRHFAADAAEFSLSGLAFVVLQFLTVLFQFFQLTDRQEGDE